MQPQTTRQRIQSLLFGDEMSAREISQGLGITEKEVYQHLYHVARSLSAVGRRLVVRPAECRHCGYVFADRRRLTRPGRCPQCKQSHLQGPRFRIS